MYKEILRSIDNVAIYPVFSFVLFGLFFLGMLILVFKLDKNHVQNMSSMPINDDNLSTNPLDTRDNEKID